MKNAIRSIIPFFKVVFIFPGSFSPHSSEPATGFQPLKTERRAQADQAV